MEAITCSLIVIEYLCLRWQQMCFNCYNHNPVLSNARIGQFRLILYLQEQHDGCHLWNSNCLHYQSTWVELQFFMEFVLIIFVFFHVVVYELAFPFFCFIFFANEWSVFLWLVTFFNRNVSIFQTPN